MNQEKLDDYYDKIEAKIAHWDENVTRYREKYRLLKILPMKTTIRLVKAGPLVLHLLISLLNHPEVSKKTKRRVAVAVGYFVMPFDVIPEAVAGPVGYVDDVVVALALVNSLLNGDNEREKEIINEIWRGSAEELTALRGIVKGIDLVRNFGKYIQRILPG
ncbi:MAG: hypothetical protein MAGBODY4_01726 [Candidatus Marinimicrobia bacterium]|nr:hypothetical protein [Candidatus Neomarinimicrobiota bacterium]